MVELENMPLDTINVLYKIAEERTKAEQKQREEEAKEGKNPSIGQRELEQLEDELEGV